MPRSRLIDATCHFDLTTAEQLARAAELVYEEPHIVERTLVGRGKFSQFCFFDVEATQCFVAADRDSIVVCFRGTEAGRLGDWIVDLDFDLVQGPLQGQVHEGFYDALSSVWHVLDGEVRRLQAARRRRLWVTGHSLGAGLATLAVARWREAGRPVAGLYTFGQPRTGDRVFARNFDFAFRPHTFRIVNQRDVVTRTPPRTLGYRHLGTFIYITESGDLDDDVGWWRQFLDGWQGAIETILEWGGGGLDHHRMSDYRQRIASAVADQSNVQAAAAHLRAGFPPDSQPSPTRIKPRRRTSSAEPVTGLPSRSYRDAA